MDFFNISPEDPADDWKKEQGAVNGDALSKEEQKAFVEKFFFGSSPPPPHYDLDCPLCPTDPVTLLSETGKHSTIVSQINARFRELGFLNCMVKDYHLFMAVFVGAKSCLIIQRKAVPFSDMNPQVVAAGGGGGYAIVSHKFLSPKTKGK